MQAKPCLIIPCKCGKMPELTVDYDPYLEIDYCTVRCPDECVSPFTQFILEGVSEINNPDRAWVNWNQAMEKYNKDLFEAKYGVEHGNL